MNLSPSDESLAKSCRLIQRLGMRAQTPGNHLGDRSGGSLLFHDHREYFPGDDVRRIDWNAYGRTDQLVMKNFQEEISPVLELIIDMSSSMQVYPEKYNALVRWTWFLVTVGLHSGFTVSIHRMGQDRAGIRPEELQGSGWRFSPQQSLHELVRRYWKGKYRSLRVILSDFFFEPNQLPSLLSLLGRDSLALFGVQILDAEEMNPTMRGAFRMVDADTQQVEQILVSEREVEQYLQRLSSHQQLLHASFQRHGGGVAVINASRETREVLMKTLLPLGMVGLV